MESLLLPYFRLQESEDEMIKTKRKPWWQFWRN
jgi:hypothetical protein